MAKFDPSSYLRYRPLYPSEVYRELPIALASRGFRPPFEVADIGCGTGHSTLSLLRSGLPARVTGVEPDAAMLAEAPGVAGEEGRGARWVQGSGEATSLPGASRDAVTVGSAFHWMDARRARDEFLRVLRPGGALLVFEYQFPKALTLPGLNEWIRREFNLRWKAPAQRPRGDFKEVTRVFREDGRFALLSDRRVPMVLSLDAAELAGLILSQSRVIHYENTLTEGENGSFRSGLVEKLSGFLGEARADFDFNLQASLFAADGHRLTG